MTTTHISDRRFSDFDLPETLHQGINAAGFVHCTPIQAETLPHALTGHDIAGQAQTGTGKTAAFLIALFNHLLTRPATSRRRSDQPRALILAPTRELAIQIHKDAKVLGHETGLVLGLVYGGTGYEQQRQMLEDGVDVLIGTPGRIIDYFRQKIFDLRALQVMIVDEADRMFDLGFIKDIRYLLRRMPSPERRLNMLFSATLSYQVTELAYEHMNDPELIEVVPEQVTAEQIDQIIYYPAIEEKIPLLLGLLRKFTPKRAIVFINTKRGGERVYSYMLGNGIQAELLSGDVPQKKRQRLITDFAHGTFRVLVATDVAARGLHIPDVTHIFNYDLPQDREDYVHRIGRTARAGAQGHAISFACERYAFSLSDIEEYIRMKIPAAAISEELLARPEPPANIDHHHNHRSKGGGRPVGDRPRHRRPPRQA